MFDILNIEYEDSWIIAAPHTTQGERAGEPVGDHFRSMFTLVFKPGGINKRQDALASGVGFYTHALYTRDPNTAGALA